MLRISVTSEPGQTVLRLEGCLTDASVREAEAHWDIARSEASGVQLTVDLRDLLRVDAAGRKLLVRMHRDGAQFVVAGCAMRALVAELNDAADRETERMNGGIARAVPIGKGVSGES